MAANYSHPLSVSGQRLGGISLAVGVMKGHINILHNFFTHQHNVKYRLTRERLVKCKWRVLANLS